MVSEAGADYVIIGHSERRQLFGETDQTVNRKLRAALARRPHPDRLHRRDAGRARGAARRWPCSIARSRTGSTASPATRSAALVIAYEPVWAIGTGRTATAAQAQEAHAHIRQRLRQWFGGPAADECHVIYGGSVKPDNTKELLAPARRRWRAGRRRLARHQELLRDRQPLAPLTVGQSPVMPKGDSPALSPLRTVATLAALCLAASLFAEESS